MKKKLAVIIIGVMTIMSMTGCSVEVENGDVTINGHEIITSKTEVVTSYCDTPSDDGKTITRHVTVRDGKDVDEIIIYSIDDVNN